MKKICNELCLRGKLRMSIKKNVMQGKGVCFG